MSRADIKVMMVGMRKAIWTMDPANVSYERLPLSLHYDTIAATMSGMICRGETVGAVCAWASYEFKRRFDVDYPAEKVLEGLAEVKMVRPTRRRP